jgi:hypothetical protein
MQVFLPVGTRVYEDSDGNIHSNGWYIYREYIPQRLTRRIMTIDGTRAQEDIMPVPPTPKASPIIRIIGEDTHLAHIPFKIYTVIPTICYNFFRRYIHRCEFRVSPGKGELVTFLCNKYTAGFITPVSMETDICNL